MISVQEVLEILKTRADPDRLQGMARFGMTVEKRLGVSIPDIRKLAKKLGKNHELALKLWHTGIAEAQIVAGMIADPNKLTTEQMDDWVKDLNSWDVCDQLCMNLFDRSPQAWRKIHEWSVREEEFVKRAAYALIACIAWHDKETSDDKFIELLPVIVQGATDERNYVKKAVNWALRQIGKRNGNLNRATIDTAKSILQIDSKAARWIASDAIRELQSDAVRTKLNKKR